MCEDCDPDEDDDWYDDVDPNWCPACGEPIFVCACDTGEPFWVGDDDD